MGLASLILGIISIVTLLLTLVVKISFGPIPTICAIIGLILGIIDNRKAKNKKAIIGIVLCSVYILIFIILIARTILMVRSLL